MAQWNDTQPIFLQIRQQMVRLILDGNIAEGDAVPSIRQVATDLSVNPLTVTRAYQSLADGGIVEKRRGLGMYVTRGARETLLRQEREKFLNEEWPLILTRIDYLGLKLRDLMTEKDDK